MSILRIIGIMLIIVGVILLVMGFNATESVADRMSNFFTGKFTESTIWFLILGAASTVGGILLTLFGGGKSIT